MWTDEEIDSFVNKCFGNMVLANDRLEKEYDLGHFERFDFDVPNGCLVFSDTHRTVRFEIALICSTDTTKGTLQWAWANISLPHHLTKESSTLKTLAKESGLNIFDTPIWEASEEEGWEMAAIALEKLGGLGVYRCPTGSSMLFVVLMSVV
ncbi:DUF6882 domain-containing protein [Vibrio cionasavignyae]|uniref:DUF6882 domain-containing protein n=1 Tax=Vibrio cionasavignyae TaxID=2910252 RepID=UPI003D0AC774